MILQALDRYYRRLARREKPIVPTFGYSDQPISFALVVNQDGSLVDVVPIGTQGKRSFQPKRLPVPAPVIRTSGVASNFLWDKSAYVLGVKRDPNNTSRIIDTPRERTAFRAMHEELLTELVDDGLQAVLGFLRAWSPSALASALQDVLDTNLVFRLDGELRFVHDRPAAQEIWARHLASKSGSDGLCLVTGDVAPIARLHPAIKGVQRAQSSGASIVSFNLDAFTSLGKDQGLNAPVSEKAAFSYTTVLNHLLRLGEHNRQRLQIADATTVFWAEARSPDDEEAAAAAEDLFGLLLAPPSEEKLDAQEAAKIATMLGKFADGRPLQDIHPKLDPQTRFFVLGLAPNAARLSVRFWEVDEFGVLAERFRKHWQDLAIEPQPWKTLPAIWRLLYETAAQRKAENIPARLAGDVMRAILTGAHYPATLFASIIMRCRADHDLNGIRAAILKGCLVRADRKAGRKESVSMSLDPQEINAGYRLGRLFAVLESIQRAALGKVNATIRDRYYGAASATPGSVFPLLLRTAGHHLANVRKGDKPKLAAWFEREIGDIMAGIETSLPRNLSIGDQGRFAIGYYHQRFARRGDAPAELITFHAEETDISSDEA